MEQIFLVMWNIHGYSSVLGLACSFLQELIVCVSPLLGRFKLVMMDYLRHKNYQRLHIRVPTPLQPQRTGC